jgi:hypothetical protein
MPPRLPQTIQTSSSTPHAVLLQDGLRHSCPLRPHGLEDNASDTKPHPDEKTRRSGRHHGVELRRPQPPLELREGIAKTHRGRYLWGLRQAENVRRRRGVDAGLKLVCRCPGHFKANCRDIDDYMFYLSFENSNCDGYVTEKVWWNAYEKNSIPIVMGASQENYRKLLPPRSYLNIDDYAHPKDLATYIRYLNSTGKYREYYAWKRDFEVLNEHGYFQSKSYHYCRVCEALNYNDKKTKVYQDLRNFWNVSKDCHPAWDA